MKTILIFIVLLMVSSKPARSQDRQQKSLPDPHHHLVSVDTLTDVASDVNITPLRLGAAEVRDSVASPDGQWIAFVFSASDEWARVGFEDKQKKIRYQIIGLPLPYRPIDDLVWIGSTTIAFDRWSQPHYGIHYVVDVRMRKVLRAAPFPDAFLFQQHDTLR